MKFKTKFPAAKPGDAPEMLMEQTDRLGRCNCGAATTWRWMTAGLGLPICSEECLDGLKSDIVAEGLQVPEGFRFDAGCTSQGGECACRTGLLVLPVEPQSQIVEAQPEGLPCAVPLSSDSQF